MKYLKSIIFIGGLIWLSSLLNLTIFAQSGGSFEIKQSVIASGGGSGTGGTFSLDGTIGQPLAGTTSGGASFSILSGFWASGTSVTAPRRSPFDFDGDGKTDISIFRPAPAEWWYLRSSNGGNRRVSIRQSTDKIVPADYTGDGKTDIAFWRPSNGFWFILRTEDSSFLRVSVRHERRHSRAG